MEGSALQCTKPASEPEGKGGGDGSQAVQTASVPVRPEATGESTLCLTYELNTGVMLG